MAGKKGRSGRRPKPDALKIASGTYRADRSGDLASKVTPEGKPERPHFTNPDAAAMWDREVEELMRVGVATVLDGPMLQIMCELYGLYRASYAIAELDPTDKDARIATATYATKVDAIASRFGLNASDRGRLKVDVAKPAGIQARKRG